MSQENSALLPNNYDNLPREAKKTADSTYQRIYKYFFNSNTRIELTTEEKHISERWERAWVLLCRHRTRKQVAELLMKFYNIGKSVAYDDVRNAMDLFGDPGQDVKTAKKAIAEDAILRGADRAWKKGDLELHHKYMKEYIELNGLKNEDTNDLSDLMRKLRAHTLVIVATMPELQAEAEKLQADLVKDIDHIEINDDEDQKAD
jgi:hypothetical protein